MTEYIVWTMLVDANVAAVLATFLVLIKIFLASAIASPTLAQRGSGGQYQSREETLNAPKATILSLKHKRTIVAMLCYCVK